MNSITWDYWICLYTQTHCVARGLRPLTIAAYRTALRQFESYVQVKLEGRSPDRITAADVLGYLEHLRTERKNGDSSINRTATILKNFYRAMVGMGHLEPRANPMAQFPRLRPPTRKLPVVLSSEEVQRLLEAPPGDTAIGLRDRAILALLYGTGIRASECAGLNEADVDLSEREIRVRGKGGHERSVPLNSSVVEVLTSYRQQRGEVEPRDRFFQSRRGQGMSRGAIYERVKKYARLSRIPKEISPHKLRHTFATHLVRRGVDLVTIRDLLGHRSITSTQVYLHVTAEDLRAAADQHPIGDLAGLLKNLLPQTKLPFQHAPPRRQTG
ncbi:tyrosine-type recombinase/integrase [Humisphaera borealis]|uniref:Tyrosine-type recombinase/integrase n=1 Tax=Humisphaera borealis TaxID=2807512 RepID=A0A7M2X363_9BACT|nr:tyrosine-type recombinase/integrase [Humisphaera borealis]QOV92114.1 tyrosine-type recombinase/integrase [Humisphaera borealis]